ncbi:unnamed protein product [Taenia asiatica]|uniref:CUB domain-containing protein n=1 Tax=Taenia asiatica TaxID=60517 RepID=A0A0R3VUQ8_TAEAS|nr:unnamed protein product [Taenia asiatica]
MALRNKYFNLHSVYLSSEAGLAAEYEASTGFLALPSPSQVLCGDHLAYIKSKGDLDDSTIVSFRSILGLKFKV